MFIFNEDDDVDFFLSDDEILEMGEGDFDNVVDEKFFNNDDQPPSEYSKEDEDFNTRNE